jgi:hypothetical protein
MPFFFTSVRPIYIPFQAALFYISPSSISSPGHVKFKINKLYISICTVGAFLILFYDIGAMGSDYVYTRKLVGIQSEIIVEGNAAISLQC